MLFFVEYFYVSDDFFDILNIKKTTEVYLVLNNWFLPYEYRCFERDRKKRYFITSGSIFSFNLMDITRSTAADCFPIIRMQINSFAIKM